MTSIKFNFILGEDSTVYEDALAIRRKVFIEEQGISEADEIDDLDGQTYHIVGYQDGQAQCTARLYIIDDHVAKVQRVAVLPEGRGQHLGSAMMLYLEDLALDLDIAKVTLGAQESAVPFYEKLNYTVEGEPFMDAGIPHYTMTKKL